MLCAMTYNVGVFLALVFGFGFAHFVFYPYRLAHEEMSVRAACH